MSEDEEDRLSPQELWKLWEAAEQSLQDQVRGARCAKIRSTDPGRADWFWVIHPCVRGDNPPQHPLQVTHFDKDGPSGHTCVADMAAAISDIMFGYGRQLAVEEVVYGVEGARAPRMV